MHEDRGSGGGRLRQTAVRQLMLLVLLMSAGGCGTDRMATIDPTPPRSVNALSARKVLFGHQSVGANLLDGIGSLEREQAWPGPRIVELGPAGVESNAIVHFRVGRNGDARSKIASFESTLRSLAAAPPDLAGFKFCYSDFDSATDVEEVFRTYRETLDRLGREFPSVRFFHLTVPVERNESLPKVFVKRALGRPTAQDANQVRGRYNRMLLEAYGPAVFDLAAAEADGAPDPAELSLASRYTDDGEHLNASGKRSVGGRFAVFLAGFAEAGDVAR